MTCPPNLLVPRALFLMLPHSMCKSDYCGVGLLACGKAGLLTCRECLLAACFAIADQFSRRLVGVFWLSVFLSLLSHTGGDAV